MTKKRIKKKSHGKKGPKDPLRLQIGVAIKAAPGSRVTRELMNEIIRMWAESGRSPEGTKVTMVRWLNPKRVNKSLAVWKEASTPRGISKAHATLHIRELLRSWPTSFQSFRSR